MRLLFAYISLFIFLFSCNSNIKSSKSNLTKNNESKIKVDTSFNEVLKHLNKREIGINKDIYVFSKIDTIYTIDSMPLINRLVKKENLTIEGNIYSLKTSYKVNNNNDKCSVGSLYIIIFKDDSVAIKTFSICKYFANNDSRYEFDQLFFISQNKIYLFTLDKFNCYNINSEKSKPLSLLLYFAKYFSGVNTKYVYDNYHKFNNVVKN